MRECLTWFQLLEPPKRLLLELPKRLPKHRNQRERHQ
jgi:hypothetical protein